MFKFLRFNLLFVGFLFINSSFSMEFELEPAVKELREIFKSRKLTRTQSYNELPDLNNCNTFLQEANSKIDWFEKSKKAHIARFARFYKTEPIWKRIR